MNKKSLINIPNTIESLMALILVIPAYMIILLGTDQVTQGAAYALYGLMPVALLLRGHHKMVPTKFLISYWIIFLLAWLLPNIYNISTGSLESYLISIPVLTFHVVVLTLVVISLSAWQSKIKPNESHQFFKTELLLLTPLLMLMSFKILTTWYADPSKRVLVFGYAHLNAEILLIGLFLTYFCSNRAVKLAVSLVLIACMIVIHTRSGLIAALLYVFFVNYHRSWLKFNLKRLVLWGAASSFIVIAWQPIFAVLDSFLFLTDPGREPIESGFTARISIWQVAWQEILNHPWIGIGFFTRPNPWFRPEHVGLYVHNAFLRLWVENGTVLFVMAVSTLLASGWQMIQKQMRWELAVFTAILFYYFFYPRHLTLNPMSILLYLLVVRAFVSPRQLRAS